MATKSKSGLSATPTKVSPATTRVASKLSRGLAAKPEPGPPSHLQATRHSIDRSSLNSKPAVDRGSQKVDPERGSPSPLRGTRHLVDRSPRSSSLSSKMSIDRRSPKVEPEPGSPSPLQATRHSVDRSPRSSSLNSKPSVDRGSPRLATPSEKSQTRIGKGSELQAQLNSVQDDLKKAKEQISSIEKEKAQAIDDLKEARKAADEANEKLREALFGQKRAEESLEIEKFRSVELEEAGIEAAHMKDKEWLNEIRSIRKQHASDAAVLCSTIEELERVKQELAMVCDAKNQALNHADDATKIAEIHAEEVEFLSAELAQLKSLIDSEKETNENRKMVTKCKQEIESLKQQLEEAMTYEEMLLEKEALIEQLNIELEAARIAELYALNIVEEWKKRFKELQMQIAEEKKLERSSTESLDTVMEQLENNDKSLIDAKSEMTALKEKVGFLEVTISKQIGDLVESEHCINIAKEETNEVTKLVESLKFELETAKEENTRALNNEKLAASSVQTLLEEKTKLVDELENLRDEMEKSKKEMESLASALNQVSAEAREAKEKLLSSEKEHVNYKTKLEELRSVLKATKEKYETMLDNAQKEIDHLTSAFEQSKNTEYPNSGRKDENSSREKEISRLVNLLKQSEEEASAFKEEEAQLKESLEEAESEVIYLQEDLREVQTESIELKASLLNKETELQSVVRENEELQAREAASLKKDEELSKLLEEATMKKQREENDEPSNCEKDFNLQPKAAVEESKENRHGSKENRKVKLPSEQPLEVNDGGAKVENADGQQVKEAETKHNKDDSKKVEFNMLESCKIENKEFFREREPASKKKQQQKKKNALLSKFVSLLKKGSNNQK
ncbi:WEB family protein At3g02930, chloroplastic-like [Hibiscus syriacus]|uniref:WEB family protein At3g02930, chloroplastic-like n=1 Tax=Hibiscus syriacus TaxID=106335 RepID=UPI0019212B3E|nr:WEB family protein At3g02930, chloroplastic-like [Hibiscus syriacus]